MKRSLGAVIKEVRKERGLSQLMLAHSVGTDATNIGRIERGIQGVSHSRLEAIANALGVTVLEIHERCEGVHRPKGTVEIVYVPVVAVMESDDGGGVGGGLSAHLAERQHDEPLGWVVFPVRDASAFAVQVRGDALGPRIKGGEYVIFERDVPIEPGDEIGILLKDGRQLIRLLIAKVPGGIRVMDINERGGVSTIFDEDCGYLLRLSGVANPSLHRAAKGSNQPQELAATG